MSGAVLGSAFLLMGAAFLRPDSTARADPDEKQQLADAIKVKPGVTCLDGRVLTKRVQKWLGGNELDRRIRVYVEGAENSATEASFTITKGDGYVTSRRFTSAPEDCSEFHSALALSIAMAIQGTYLEPAPDLPSYSGGLRRVAIVPYGFANIGVVTHWPTFALGLGGRFELGWLDWLDTRMGIFFTYALPQYVTSGVDATFDAQLWGLRGDACYGEGIGKDMRWRFCGGFMYGQFRTEGLKGLTERHVRAAPWGAIPLGVDLTGDLFEWLAIGGGVDAVIPWWERIIQVMNRDGSVGPERSLPPVGVTAGINIVFSVRPKEK